MVCEVPEGETCCVVPSTRSPSENTMTSGNRTSSVIATSSRLATTDLLPVLCLISFEQMLTSIVGRGGLATRIWGRVQTRGSDVLRIYVCAPRTTREIKDSIFSSYTEPVRTMQSEKADEDVCIRTRHRDGYKESVDRVVYSQISSSCSTQMLPGCDPNGQTRPPYVYRTSP